MSWRRKRLQQKTSYCVAPSPQLGRLEHLESKSLTAHHLAAARIFRPGGRAAFPTKQVVGPAGADDQWHHNFGLCKNKISVDVHMSCVVKPAG